MSHQPPVLSYARTQPYSKLAVASLVFGCVAFPGIVTSMCMCCIVYSPVALGTAVAAVVCGGLALWAIRHTTGGLRGGPLAVIGMCLGGVVLAVHGAMAGVMAVAIFTGSGPTITVTPSTTPAITTAAGFPATTASAPATGPASAPATLPAEMPLE